MQGGVLGYWVDQDHLRRGLATGRGRVPGGAGAGARACTGSRPAPWSRTCRRSGCWRRCGYEQYGLAPKLLFLNGAWRDHVLFQKLLHDRPLCRRARPPRPPRPGAPSRPSRRLTRPVRMPSRASRVGDREPHVAEHQQPEAEREPVVHERRPGPPGQPHQARSRTSASRCRPARRPSRPTRLALSFWPALNFPTANDAVAPVPRPQPAPVLAAEPVEDARGRRGTPTRRGRAASAPAARSRPRRGRARRRAGGRRPARSGRSRGRTP